MDDDNLIKSSPDSVVKKINLSAICYDNSESNLKCKLDVNQLLSDQKRILEQPRIEKCDSLSEAEWIEDLKLAKVTKVTKNLTKNFSHTLNKIMYLYPEECLCLLEMKCLVLKWNERKLSIKNAFSLLLAVGSGCTFEQFRTYGYLVKLGFRVFKHDNNLKNNTYDPKNLTKLKSLKLSKSAKKRALRQLYKAKNCLQLKNNVSLPKLKCTNKIISTPKSCYLPKLKFTNEIISTPKSCYLPKLKFTNEIILTPKSCYLPYNLQPYYDVYSFDLCVIGGSSKITNYSSFKEQTDSKIKKSLSQPIEMYPSYEKNIPQKIKSEEENIYEPRNKRLKLTETIENNSHITQNKIAYTSINDNNSSTLNSSTILTCEDLKSNNILESGKEMNSSVILNIGSNFCALNNKINDNNKLLDSKNNDDIQHIKVKFGADSTKNENLSKDEKNEADSKLPESIPYNSISEDKLLNMHLNVPSHIRQKLLAIEPSTVLKESTKNTINMHCVHYDVYYPNNTAPKTSRPAPDFRVIVFEDDLEHFPKIHDINVSNPNDNIPTLWAIVNSSSVSFFSVDNIILPKTTDWNKKHN